MVKSVRCPIHAKKYLETSRSTTSRATISKTRASLRTLGYHAERQEEAEMVTLQAHTTVGNFGRIFRELRGPRSWIPQSER